jgi:hypothetical protein
MGFGAVVVVAAFALLPAVWSANGAEGELNLVIVYPSSVTEQLAAALAAPLPFAFLWLLLRVLPRRR